MQPTSELPGQGVTAFRREYLDFRLGQEEYGIDILRVQEIRGYENVTRLANAPDYIKGVVNLRGTIVPIVDMRILLGISEGRYDEHTVVIVLNIRSRVIGMVVDGVSDVTMLSPEHIRPVPEMGGAIDTRYLLGLGTIDQRMLILIDIEKLISEDGLRLLDAVVS